jgi:hypothetical protein
MAVGKVASRVIAFLKQHFAAELALSNELRVAGGDPQRIESVSLISHHASYHPGRKRVQEGRL